MFFRGIVEIRIIVFYIVFLYAKGVSRQGKKNLKRMDGAEGLIFLD